MDYKEMVAAIRLCGNEPNAEMCKQCPYWAGGDMMKCIPHMTEDAATAITDLLAHAEAAEKELEWKNMVIEAAERRFTEAEAKCKRLDESRERANESAYMWESRCKMLEEQKAAPEEVREAIDGLIEFARERMSITDWLYYVNVIGPWRGEKEE